MTTATLETWHGSLAGYNRHGCRCDECSQASRAYHQSYRTSLKGRYRPEPAPVSWCECGKQLPHKGRCENPEPVTMPRWF